MSFSSAKPKLKEQLGELASILKRHPALVAGGIVAVLAMTAFFGLSGSSEVADPFGVSDAEIDSDLQLLGAVGVRDSGSASVGADPGFSTADSDPGQSERHDGVGHPLFIADAEFANSGSNNFKPATIETGSRSGPLFGTPLTIPTEPAPQELNLSTAGSIRTTQLERPDGLTQASNSVTRPAAAATKSGSAAWLTGTISID